ncbi:MAG: YraN family protein [Bacteroides sp.]|nr:YraN family protein [Bacteroides sp.]
MAKHNELGKAGETAALDFLQELGYRILHRNWRKGHLELDIVGMDEDELVVVEVKTRSSDAFLRPEEAVNEAKIRHTVRAADAYMKCFAVDNPVRFDIVTVVGTPESFRIEHIKDAFTSPLF